MIFDISPLVPQIRIGREYLNGDQEKAHGFLLTQEIEKTEEGTFLRGSVIH